jgi:hypothetical protein
MRSLIKLALCAMILGGALAAPAANFDTLNCPTGKILVCVKFVCSCVTQP